MKFIKLESRGGNYLVVAQNVAWLRTAEKGQTNVGIIGGQPLLVVGSIEEVAEKILNGVNGLDAEEAHAPASPAPGPQSSPLPQETAPLVVAEPAPVVEPEPVAAVAPQVAPEAPVHMPEPEPEPFMVTPAPAPEPVATIQHVAPEAEREPEVEREPAFAPVRLQPRPAPGARPRPPVAGNAPLWERPAPPAATGLKIKAGSQRMMGMLE